MEYWLDKDRTIAFGYVDGVAVSIMGPKAWSDESWDEYIAASRVRVKHTRPFVFTLSYLSNEVPSAGQRKRLRDNIESEKHEQMRSLLITDSTVGRAATTAFSLMLRISKSDLQIRAFPPAHIQQAYEWLRSFSTFDESMVTATVIDMMTAVGYPPKDTAALRSR